MYINKESTMLTRKSIRWVVIPACILAFAVFSPVLCKTASNVAKTSPAAGLKTDTLAKGDTAKPAAVTLQPQTTCPVMGEKINKKFYVDYQGKRIYACCAMCPPEIRKDPEKYIRKLEAMGQGVETLGDAKTKKERKNTEKPDSSMKGMKM